MLWTLFFASAALTAAITLGIGVFVFGRDYNRFLLESQRLRADYILKRQQTIRAEVEKAVEFIQYNRSKTETRLKESIQERAYEAHAIATHLYENLPPGIKPEEKRKLILEALRPIRFNNGRGYYFATRLDGVELLFADHPELEGRNLLDLQDPSGAYVIRDMIEIIRSKGEGFYRYLWTKPDSQGRSFPKIAYIKYFKPLDCLVGVGEYLDDVESDIQREVLDRIGKIRFGDDGYIFVVNYDGVTLMNGVQPELVGKNLWEMTDPYGVKVIQEERKAAETPGGAFIHYHWEKPTTKCICPKISFVKGFPEWRWMVGAGVYSDEVESVIDKMAAQMRRKMVSAALDLGVILACALMGSLVICYLMYRYLRGQFEIFLSFFRNMEKGGAPIDTDSIFLTELYELGASANAMLEKRRRAEAELRESEERLALAMMGTDLGVWDWNVQTGEAVYGGRWASMLGFWPDEIAPHYDSWRGRINPDDVGAVERTLSDHLEGKTPLYESEFRMRHKSGQWVWVLARGKVIAWDKDGKPLRACGTHLEITERRRIEAERRLNAQRLEALLRLNRMSDGPIEQFSAFALEEGVRLTESAIGYISLVNEEEGVLAVQAWSERAVRDCGLGVEEKLLRRVEDAGLWGESVRRRQPVVVNDYGAEGPSRIGLPPGHVPVLRFLSVPVFDDGRIVLVAGVGNKSGEYDESDVRQLTLLMEGMWSALRKKKSEDELRQSEQRFHALLSNMSEGVALQELVVDGEGRPVDYRIIDVNPGFERILGISRSQAVGKLATAVYGTAMAPYLREYAGVALSGSPLHMEAYFAPMGKYFEVSAAPWGEGGFATMFSDVTFRIMSEKALRESEMALQRAQSIAHVGSYAWDLESGKTLWSDELQRIAGCTTPEPSLEFISSLMHSEDRKRVTVSRRLARDEGVDFDAEYRIVKPNGELRWLHERAELDRDEAGLPVRMLGVIQDITESKKSEEEREVLEMQLRQAQKLEAVGTLAGGVAHDFNNLLQVINGYTELILAKLGPEHSAYASLREVAKAGGRAAGLVGQLLAFSRRQVLRPEDLDMNEVTSHLLKMLVRLIGEHIRLDFIPGQGIEAVHGDRGMVEQVLVNLCVNARDAMRDGGVLTIETENVWLDSSYCEKHPWAVPGRYVLLSVTDTGEGMDRETIDRIFEPFFTTKAPGQGTGLGLATVYGIIKQHQGMVHVYSEPGKGSVFRIYLPVAERMAVDAAPRTELPIRGGDELILLAEDEDMVRDFTARVLEGAGYRVLTARNGEDALALLRDNPQAVDLMLLDVVMPKLGGRLAYEQAQKIRADIPVLFASGYTENAIHANFVLEKGLKLIQKPFSHEGLLRLVRETLDERKRT